MSKVSNNQSFCIVCGFNLSHFPNRVSLYGEVPDNHWDDPSSVKLVETIPVNPNTYESIWVILKYLQEQPEVEN